jgi:hypothetical protein
MLLNNGAKNFALSMRVAHYKRTATVKESETTTVLLK